MDIYPSGLKRAELYLGTLTLDWTTLVSNGCLLHQLSAQCSSPRSSMSYRLTAYADIERKERYSMGRLACKG